MSAIGTARSPLSARDESVTASRDGPTVVDHSHSPVGLDALCDRLTLEQGSEGMFDADSFMRAAEYAQEAKAATVARDVAGELAAALARIESLECRGSDTELVGTLEVAAMLGVKVGTVHMWQHRGRLPARDATVSGLPAWRADSILEWARETGRIAS